VSNPFRTEAAAFRFVFATIAYFALIALASVLGGPWLGFAVFCLLTAGAAYWFFAVGRPEPVPPTAPAAVEHPGERRILVVANETVLGRALRDCLAAKTEGSRAAVHVVSPALNTPLKHWVSDEDGAREAAAERLATSVAHLREAGFDATGEVGDGDPVQAIDDALRTFAPDEVIISTHPEGRSNWLERGVVETARERFVVDITHVVVDLDAEREEVR
jgi:nucleotide-binding universal stress UspA family protein